VTAPAHARPAELSPEVAASVRAQVTAAVGSMQKRPDGVYRVSVRLDPDELGPVHLDVEVHGTHLRVHLDAETDAARHTLKAGVDQLRASLEGAGTHSADVDVGNGGPRHHQPAATPAFPRRGAPTARIAGDATSPLAPPVPANDRGLNLRL
jgi:flagellar hook-length control protein FliK